MALAVSPTRGADPLDAQARTRLPKPKAGQLAPRTILKVTAMKKPIRIEVDGPYYPKPTLAQRVWNWLLLVAVVIVGAAWLTGCASTSTTSGKQDLVLDKEVQPMSRNEVVSAIGDCQANNLRAVLMYGKRKVNGYTADVVIDVTCAPKW